MTEMAQKIFCELVVWNLVLDIFSSKCRYLVYTHSTDHYGTLYRAIHAEGVNREVKLDRIDAKNSKKILIFWTLTKSATINLSNTSRQEYFMWSTFLWDAQQRRGSEKTTCFGLYQNLKIAIKNLMKSISLECQIKHKTCGTKRIKMH